MLVLKWLNFIDGRQSVSDLTYMQNTKFSRIAMLDIGIVANVEIRADLLFCAGYLLMKNLSDQF